MTRREGFFTGDGDARLFYQLWSPAGTPKGLLTITHGQGEHSESYHRLVDALIPAGWEIMAWDLRGHGRSDGQRGYVPHFDTYVRDYDCFIRETVEPFRTPGRPLVHLAHSLGGLIHLKLFLGDPELRKRNQILSSPFLGLSFPVSAHKHYLAKALINFLPKVTLSDDLTSELLSRDVAVQEEYKRDTLRHGKISANVYLGALEAIDVVHQRAELLEGRCLFVIPEKDMIVNSPATVKFFGNVSAKDKTLKVYPGRRHELFNDLDRADVFNEVLRFLSHTK